MRHPSFPALFAFVLVLTACGTPPGAPPSGQAAATAPSGRAGQLELALASGTYRCDDGVRLVVERESRDQMTHRVKIGWNGSHYRLDRDLSYSGLPRFEDTQSGLVWIDLPWKGMLLDGRSNKPLANECRSL